MENAISKNFNFTGLIQFALPTIFMMVILSLYTTVDGAFVSKLISEDALASVNIVYPIYSVFLAISLMLATGSNAIIAKHMGEGRYDEARSFLSLIYVVGIGSSVVFGAFAFFSYRPILSLLGSTPELEVYTVPYLRVLAVFVPMSFLQTFAQTFLVTEGKPQLGLGLVALGGLLNVGLDYVFIRFFNMGIAGAALGTGIGASIPSLFGLFYFLFNKKGSLFFVKPEFNGKKLAYSLFNGSSEFINNVSIAITTLMFNYAMLKYAGEGGVAAISAVLYLQFIQASVYFGFSSGIAPVISFKYGEGNRPQLKNVVKIGLTFITACSLLVFVLSLLLAGPAVSIFVSPESATFALARRGFLLFSLSYLFMGINVFVSAMFTALGNGKISALLSFLRTLVFIVGSLLLLPPLFEIDGVWLAVPAAEALAFIISLLSFTRKRSSYGY